MIGKAVLLDSAVLATALGEDSALRESCLRIVAAVANDSIRGYASVETVQELVHHRLRRTGDRAAAAADGRDVGAICTLLAFDREVLDLALDLIERTAVRGRDAVHAATAIAYGIDTIVSPDRAFDGIPGVIRADPVEFAVSLSP